MKSSTFQPDEPFFRGWLIVAPLGIAMRDQYKSDFQYFVGQHKNHSFSSSPHEQGPELFPKRTVCSTSRIGRFARNSPKGIEKLLFGCLWSLAGVLQHLFGRLFSQHSLDHLSRRLAVNIAEQHGQSDPAIGERLCA